MTDGSAQVPWKVDGTTGLPWFSAIHAETAARALQQDLQIVQFRLGGLGAVLDREGPAGLAALLRRVTGRAAMLLDARDQLSRQTEDRFVLITSRPPEDAGDLARSLVREMASAGASIGGRRMPRVSVGVAHVPQVTEYEHAVARLDAAVLAAEFSTGPEQTAAMEAGGTREGQGDLPAGHDAEAVPANPAETVPAGPRGGDRTRELRAVLTSLRLDLAGLVATAVVELTLGRRRSIARSVGRNTEERRLFLIGEATTRALTELLPPGYGVVIHDVSALPLHAGPSRGVLSTVLFLSPDGERFLFGVAPADADPRMAAARASLSAVNRVVAPLLSAAGA